MHQMNESLIKRKSWVKSYIIFDNAGIENEVKNNYFYDSFII